MAITVTELVETTSTANTSNIASATYQPTANRGLIAFAYVTATSAVPSSVAGNGLTWTLENTTNRGAGRLWTFSALSGSSPTNTAFSFTLTGDAGTSFFVTVLQIDGCDLTDHVVQTADAELAAGSTPAATFSAATLGTCAILGAVATLSNPPALTPPSTFTETMDAGVSNPSSGMEVVYHAAPGVRTTVTWGASTASVSSVALVEIKSSTSQNASVTPTTVSATTSVPTPAIRQDSYFILSSTPVSGSTSVPTPTVTGTSAATPTTVSATTSVPTPGVVATTASDVNVIPGTVDASTSVPTPTVTAGATATPTTVSATTAVDGASTTVNVSHILIPFTATTTVDGVIVRQDVAITLTTVSATTAVDGATSAQDANITPTTVEATVGFETPPFSIDIDVELEPTTVTATVSVPTPVIFTQDRLHHHLVAAKHRRRAVRQGLVSRRSEAPRQIPD